MVWCWCNATESKPQNVSSHIMKNVILALFLSFTFFCCQKRENILETEKIALNSVFNSVVDSIYLKSSGNKIIPNTVKKKTLIIYDSLQTETPGYFHLKRKYKTITNLYFDTISEKVTSKIDLPSLEQKANFKYKYLLSYNKDPFPANFWNSDYALLGFLLFSKINFDEERKFGLFYCTLTNGDYFRAKYFLVYIRKENNKWKLYQINQQNRKY